VPRRINQYLKIAMSDCL